MKKLFAIVLLLVAIGAGAQSVPPGFVGNPTATAYRNLAGYGMFGMPQDTFAIPTALFTSGVSRSRNGLLPAAVHHKH